MTFVIRLISLLSFVSLIGTVVHASPDVASSTNGEIVATTAPVGPPPSLPTEETDSFIGRIERATWSANYDGWDDHDDYTFGLRGNDLLQEWKKQIDDLMPKSSHLFSGCNAHVHNRQSVMYHQRAHKCGGVMFAEACTCYAKLEKSAHTPVYVRKVVQVQKFPPVPINAPSILLGLHRSPIVYLQQIRASYYIPDTVTFQMRDPRDIVISGYLYHKKTRESWAQAPQKSLGGLSYKEMINRFETQEDAIAFEMAGRSRVTLREIYQWTVIEKYTCAKVARVRYEDLWNNGMAAWQTITGFHNITGTHRDNFLSCAQKIVDESHGRFGDSAKKQELVSHHMSSHPGPGKWKLYMSRKNREQFKLLYGDLVVILGYEKDNNW